MSIITKAAKAAKRAGAWALRRAQERSTWIGLSMVAAAAGKSVLADHLTSAGDLVPMILGVGGAAIASASTTRAAA